MTKELKCWSCKAVFTLSEHADCDGCCWKCGVEIDLNEMDIQPADQQGEPVRLTAVAVLRKDGDGGLQPEWLLEGGTAELWDGALLIVADEHPELCEEDGSAELYRHAQPATAKVDERLTEATAFVQKLCDAASGQPSVATGYLSDILDVLQGRSKLNTPQ
ncbi:hypothetical protein [Pseudomonas viridiflava]|uniref:hypothetical protein n=1 Tax=Pseudomonas viridiflava TaxID=33069 RepID=UPI000F056A72|nr:hypothetical protein [Pseudomonas viridiflava]